MKKLLKYQLIQYRSLEMKVILGIMPMLTLLGWFSHHLFGVSADMILQLSSLLFFYGVLSISAIHYRHYIPTFSTWERLPLLIPLPHLWSLLSILLASLSVWATYAACYLALTFTFRHQPGLQFFDGSQWLMLTGLYILAQSIFVCLLVASGALKDRVLWPKKLGFLRKIAWWRAADSSAMFSIFWVMIVIVPLHSMVFTGYIAISGSLLALIVYASSAVLLYTASYLLEEYSNY